MFSAPLTFGRLKRLASSKHQPNNQICILKQEVADKYLKFQKSVITK